MRTIYARSLNVGIPETRVTPTRATALRFSYCPGCPKEANSDAVQAILGDRAMNGTVTNTRLAIRKLRDGPQGEEFAFFPKTVDMGVDEERNPVTSRIISWEATDIPESDEVRDRSPAEKVFDRVLADALKNHGVIIQRNGGDATAVRRDLVRDAFVAAYAVNKPNSKPASSKVYSAGS
jgi:hypothetical protein